MYSYPPLRARPRAEGNEHLLADHLLNVKNGAAEIMENIVKNSEAKWNDLGFDTQNLITLVKVVAASHDIGKASRYFQEYINPPFKNSGQKKAHSPLSALYAFYAARRLFQSNPKRDMLATFGAMCVLAHHGQLKSPSGTARDLYDNKGDIMYQLETIDGETLKQIDDIAISLGLPLFSEFKGAWKRELNYFVKLHGKSKYNSGQGLELFYLVNTIFSSLIDADRLDAAELVAPRRTDLQFDAIVNNIKMIQERGKNDASPEICNLREAIFDAVKRKSETVPLDQKLFSLTAPTGSGKTLSALYFALKLRERRGNHGPKRRIIYVAPFLSIIDQNFEVYRNVLGELGKRSDVILAHHHLCELDYHGENIEEYSTGRSVLLIEGWYSEIVVTTLVQFINSILGRGAKLLRKLHNLYGSIVILDEVQSIPAEYWKLMRSAIRCLSSLYDITFILMTATQPLIFDKGEITEIIDNYSDYFRDQNFILDTSFFFDEKWLNRDFTITDFAQYVKGLLSGEALNKNVMIILNTIGSASSLYDQLDGINDHDLYYLSAEVTPKERLHRLELIRAQMDKNRKDPEASKPVLLITTQLVEAGVDIDFDLVIRDLAPIDSIIQSAGRCNRNGKRPRGQSITKIVELKDGNGDSYAKRIYRNVSIGATEEILRNFDPSKGILELSEAYYSRMSRLRNQQEERKILKGITELDYSVLDCLHIIDESPGVSVFVELDESAEQLFKKYEEIWEKNDGHGRAIEEFLKIRSNFYSYVINVPERYLAQLGDPTHGIYHISRKNLAALYNVKGFIRNPSGII